MMGHSHAVSGVAAGMALFGTATLSIPPADSGGRTTTIPLGAGLGHLPLSAVVVASLVMGVTALLPDIDSPSSSVSTALPGITGPVSRVIARGGHRTWTHSLVGFALAAFLTYDITFWTVTVNGIDVRPGNGILLGLLLAVAARALGVPRSREGALWALFLVGFVVASIVLAAAGYDPLASFAALFNGMLGKPKYISNVVIKATPLLLTGIAVAFIEIPSPAMILVP